GRGQVGGGGGDEGIVAGRAGGALGRAGDGGPRVAVVRQAVGAVRLHAAAAPGDPVGAVGLGAAAEGDQEGGHARRGFGAHDEVVQELRVVGRAQGQVVAGAAR